MRKKLDKFFELEGKMSKQEYTLAFVLSSLKKDIQRIDLNNLLAFISANIAHENSFDFVMSNSGIFSYERQYHKIHFSWSYGIARIYR